jgi:hypothetical protein
MITMITICPAICIQVYKSSPVSPLIGPANLKRASHHLVTLQVFPLRGKMSELPHVGVSELPVLGLLEGLKSLQVKQYILSWF